VSFINVSHFLFCKCFRHPNEYYSDWGKFCNKHAPVARKAQGKGTVNFRQF